MHKTENTSYKVNKALQNRENKKKKESNKRERKNVSVTLH